MQWFMNRVWFLLRVNIGWKISLRFLPNIHVGFHLKVLEEQGDGGRDPRVQRAHEARVGRAGGRREGQGQQGGDGQAG